MIENGIPYWHDESDQHKALTMLGARLADQKNKLSPQDLRALVAEYHTKRPVEVRLGQTANTLSSQKSVDQKQPVLH